jgi:hypothetical protein
VKTENQFGTGTGYALGAVTYSSTTESKLVNNVTTNLPGAATTNTMSWWDGAVTNASSQNKDNVVTNTSFAYGTNGALTGVTAGGRAVTFVNDINGQAIRRDETFNSSSTAPHEIWYRFGGKEVGYTGNNGTQGPDYVSSIDQRKQVAGTGAFRSGAASGMAYADFDQSLAPINSYSQGGSGGSYEVQAAAALGGGISSAIRESPAHRLNDNYGMTYMRTPGWGAP